MTTQNDELQKLKEANELLSEQLKIAEKKKAIAEAEKAAEAAKKAQIDALAPAKGETKPLEGKIETDDKFGLMARLFAYQALKNCGMHIAGEIDEPDGTDERKKILIVDALDFAKVDAARLSIDAQLSAFETALASHPDQEVDKAPPETRSLTTISAVASLIGMAPAVISSLADVAGFFRSDYRVISQEVSLKQDALKVAVAGSVKKHDVHIMNFNWMTKSQLLERFLAVSAQMRTFEKEVQRLEAKASEPTDGEPRQSTVRRLEARDNEDVQTGTALAVIQRAKALLADFERFVASVTTVEGDQRQPALVTATLHDQIHDPDLKVTHLLYLEIFDASGESITKKGRWAKSGETIHLSSAAIGYVLAKCTGKVVRADVLHRVIETRYEIDSGHTSIDLLP